MPPHECVLPRQINHKLAGTGDRGHVEQTSSSSEEEKVSFNRKKPSADTGSVQAAIQHNQRRFEKT